MIAVDLSYIKPLLCWDMLLLGFPGTQLVENLPAMQETLIGLPGQEDPFRRRDRLPTPVFTGFPGGSDGDKFTCNSGDLGFNPWVGKIPWRRAWKPTPVFLLGESPWTEDPGGLQSMGSQRVRHNWETKHICLPKPISALNRAPSRNVTKAFWNQ